MSINILFLVFFFTSGLEGTELNYTFDDQADGWLRLYQVPATWTEARIRCETEGAVIASPLVDDLRDAIKRHVLQKDSSVSLIYTGVHAEYSNGDYFSIEGSHISRMTVPLEQGPIINYQSPESCIMWNIYKAKLRKLKCDIKLPYVCYKKRKNSQLFTRLGNGVSETSQGLQITELNGLENNSTIKWPLPDQGTQANQRLLPDQQWYIKQLLLPNQQPQINQPLQPNQQPQINKPLQPNQRLLPNHQSQPAYAKCSVDGTNLVIINSELESNILQYINDKQTFTFIFADTAYIKELSKTSWQVVVQKSTETIPSHQAVKPEFNETIPSFVASIPQVAPAGFQGPPSPSPSTTQTFQPILQTSEQTSSGVMLDYKYIKEAGGSLKMHEPDTWNMAWTQCASEGAVLVSPLTTELHKAIQKYVLDMNPSITRVYTGVRADYSTGDFYSSEGVSIKKMPIDLIVGDYIKYQSSEGCVVMAMDNSRAYNVKCTDRFPYICYKKKTVVRGCGTRDLEYTYNGKTDSCYKFHRRGLTWSEAYNTCVGEGAYLAIINSRTESNILKKIFANNPQNTIKGYYKSNAYIGVRDWSGNKSWKTVKDQNLSDSGYVNWAPGEPNNANGNENCGTINRNGLLYDDPCEKKLSFICEKNSEILYSDLEDKFY